MKTSIKISKKNLSYLNKKRKDGFLMYIFLENIIKNVDLSAYEKRENQTVIRFDDKLKKKLDKMKAISSVSEIINRELETMRELEKKEASSS